MFDKVIRFAAANLLMAWLLGGSPVASAADTSTLIDAAMKGSHRSAANKQRDQYRHPKETLLFFGLKPDMTVVEITPGGGWYTEILAPVLREHGTFYAATFRITEDSPAYFKNMDADYRAKLAAYPDAYGGVRLVNFDPEYPKVGPDGSANLVVTFRNVHNWAQTGTAEAMFRAFAAALAPGGYLGVVEHRAKPGTPLEQQIKSGYMTEDYVMKLATDAGFSLVEGSDINANPKDTKDYSGGVWTLLPNLRNVPDSEKAKIRAIGESDRMTLLFVKD